MVQADSPATSEGEEEETDEAMSLHSAEASREGRTERGEAEEETDEVVNLTAQHCRRFSCCILEKWCRQREVGCQECFRLDRLLALGAVGRFGGCENIFQLGQRSLPLCVLSFRRGCKLLKVGCRLEVLGVVCFEPA